jgi:mannose-6-phosphate isomerase-like protein (cupin superfamily)
MPFSAMDRHKEMHMKRLIWAAMILSLAAPSMAQSLPATDVTATDITAFIAALPADVVSDRPIRVVDVGGYRVGVFGVFRPKDGTNDANLHKTKTSEIYYMLEGSATLVTGGDLIDPRPASATSTSLRGSGIANGVTRRVGPGDVIVIPGGTAHWFSAFETDHLRYLIFRPDPENRMTLR